MTTDSIIETHRDNEANCQNCEALLDQVKALKREVTRLTVELARAQAAAECAMEMMR